MQFNFVKDNGVEFFTGYDNILSVRTAKIVVSATPITQTKFHINKSITLLII